MSGDVQPRKRKDKKKKKDEPSLPPFVYVKEEPAAAAPSARDGGGGSPSAASADELIHVYKESRLGGNICAKIIFFLLLGTLTVMVGLIITEHRGSSEVATAADSPWSQLLEGWIDDSPPDKHDDEHDAIADSGEHDEHDEGGDHDEDGHGHDEEHEEEQDEEHDEDHDEEHDDSDIVEQEYTARAARSVASESKVSGEEEDEGADEDNQEEEEEGDDEEEGDEDGGENEEEEEGADEDNQEDEKPDAVGSQEEEDGPEEFDEPDESEGQDDQESPQSTEETSQVGGEDEQDENDVSGEDNFVYKEIPGVTASAEDLDTGDDDSQGEVDQDEEDDISESAGKVSDAGYYSAHEDDNNDNDENDDDDDNDNDNGDREDEDEGQGDDNDTDDGDGDGDDVDEDEEAHEDNVSEINNEDSDLENNNSEENEEDEDQINISRNEDDSSERDANSFHLRGDQSPENEDNEDEKEGEENSDDPDEGFDEPVDSDDDNDDNNDNNLNEHSRNIDEYEEIERDFDTLGTSPLSEREDVSTEQHVESDDDFEEITDVPDNTESEKANEEEESLEPITLALKFGVGIAIIIVAHVVLVRKWNESDEAGGTALQASFNPATAAVPRRQTLIPPTVDPSNLIPEPDDVEEYSDEEFDEDEDEEDAVHTKIVRHDLDRKYGKISPEASEEEEMEEEEEDLEEDEDIEEEEDGPEQEYDKLYGYKLAAVPTKQTSEEEREEDEELDDEEDIEDEEVEDEEGEYTPHSQPWKTIRQPQQEPDQEISDGEEISGSEDEASPRPPPAVMRRTGGPKEINEFPEWPMGPDYPPEKPPTPREFQDLHTMEAQIEENPEAILKQVKRLLTSKPENVALLSLQAQALDKLAEIKRSNNLLEEAIKSYLSLLRMTDLSDNLFLKFANRTLNRMRFRGQYGDAIGVHKMLISRFPTDPRHRNDLAVSYLMAGRVSSAKLLLEEILRLWPSNGFAQVHYGFVLKTSENDNEAGSHFLQAGINSGEPGTMDARFLFHLGDAYNRLGKNIEAGKVYELGVEKGLFRSKYQRSLYNVDRLTARPWWTLHQTTYEKELRNLEEHWKEIRNEGLAILETHSKTSAFKDEAENLRDKGVWKQLELYARGQQVASNCKRAPVTCQLISQFPAARSCRRGQAKFSVMHPNTHVWPHCGPTNCRLRAHLGLVVPVGTELRVGEEKRSWQEGKMFVFDDSFEHEVWHNGSSMRLVLIIDIWHPELTDQERRSLPAI